MPILELVVLFGATVYATVPLPEPELPEVMVSQSLSLVALHMQPVLAVTFTLSLPPVEGKSLLFDVIDILQLGV
ncbi:hypothetical protein MBAV_004566, partial [Candidatus Magnetobacterium bavaricum]